MEKNPLASLDTPMWSSVRIKTSICRITDLYIDFVFCFLAQKEEKRALTHTIESLTRQIEEISMQKVNKAMTVADIKDNPEKVPSIGMITHFEMNHSKRQKVFWELVDNCICDPDIFWTMYFVSSS